MESFPLRKVVEADLNALVTYFISSDNNDLKTATIHTLHKWVSNGFRVVDSKNFSVILTEQSKNLNDPSISNDVSRIIHIILSNQGKE